MDPDPLTADVVGRTPAEEEEADAEAAGARIAGEAPVALWTPDTKARMRGGMLAPALLVFAVSPEACALLRPACDAGKLAGALVLPGASLAGNALPAGAGDASCSLYWVGGGDDPLSLIALCQHRVPDARAASLASAVATAVRPAAAAVLASLPAHAIPGTPSPDTVYALASSAGAALEAAATTAGAAPLPAGVAVAGVAAALFSFAQATDAPLLVLATADEAAGAPAPGGVAALAAAARSVASAAGAAPLAARLTAKAAAAAVAAAADADAVSARAAVYV